MLIVKEQDKNVVTQAIKALKASGVISFATDTVYALACDATNDRAVAKLYQLKCRQKQKPIAIFAKDLKTAKKILHFNLIEEKIANNFMPGALTLILKKRLITNQDNGNIIISKLLNDNSSNLGLRIPNHPFSLKLLDKFRDGFIAATSANISNKHPALTYKDVVESFGNKIDLIIDGGLCQHQLISTVVKVSDGGNIKILRDGLVKGEKIKKILKSD